jgi:hypothetical protein
MHLQWTDEHSQWLRNPRASRFRTHWVFATRSWSGACGIFASPFTTCCWICWLGFRLDHHPHTLEDVIAIAQVLRVLSKETWREADMKTLERYWRRACLVDLFADKFEGDRHIIQLQIEAARNQFVTGQRILF